MDKVFCVILQKARPRATANKRKFLIKWDRQGGDPEFLSLLERALSAGASGSAEGSE